MPSSYIFHVFKKEPDNMLEPHIHSTFEIYCKLKGTTRYLVEDAVYDIDEGDVIIIPPYVPHMATLFSQPSSSFYEHMLINLSLDTTEYFRNELEICASKTVIHMPVSRNILFNQLFEIMDEEMKKEDEYSDNAKKAAIELFLLQLARVAKGSETRSSSCCDNLIPDIVKYINAHYADPLSLSSLSKQFSMSECYLSRRFRAVTGTNLSDCIKIIRIENADRLLRSGEHTVTQTAKLCGFKDSNYLSTTFKKIKGITPKEFCRLNALKTEE